MPGILKRALEHAVRVCVRVGSIVPAIPGSFGSSVWSASLAVYLAGVLTLTFCGGDARADSGSLQPTEDAVQVSIGVNGDDPSAETGSYGSEDPSLSIGGEVLAFSSRATNLVSGFNSTESSLSPNIFIKPLYGVDRALQLISVNYLGGYPKKTGVSSSDNLSKGAVSPWITRVLYSNQEPYAYGVAFASDGEDLVQGYVKPNSSTPNSSQVYLRLPLTLSGKTVLVSGKLDDSDPFKPPAPSLTKGANGESDQPTVALFSGDVGGTLVFRVAFRSNASDLTLNTTTTTKIVIYWRDISVHTNGDVTVGPAQVIAQSSSTATMQEPAISGDGKRLAYISTGEIVAGKSSTVRQVYVSDFDSPTHRLISRTKLANTSNSSYEPVSVHSGHPSLSFFGKEVAFLHYPNTDNPTYLDGVELSTRHLLVKCSVPEQSNDSLICKQMNTTSEGEPSVGAAVSGRLDPQGRFIAFADTGGNLYQAGATGLINAQVYLKDLTPPDGVLGEPVFIASVREGIPDLSAPSGQLSGYSNLASRPPVAVVKGLNGKAVVSFSSWAGGLATKGQPSEISPYLFSAELPEAPPTDTPTPTPTPTDTATNDSSGGGGVEITPEPGELPPVDLKDGGKIEVPPQVEIIRRDGERTATIVITLPEVRVDPRIFERLKRAGLAGLAAKKGVRVRYEVEIRKAGSKQRITRTSSRNVVTVRKLNPGRYTVRYRVTATKGDKTVRSRQSPAVGVVIS